MIVPRPPFARFPPPVHNSQMTYRVGIINVTGFAGMEAARLLWKHPGARITSITGRSLAGQRLGEAFPHLEVYGEMRIGEVKTVALPGEVMPIRVVKPGDQIGQGVGYLDDGTMVVIEQGRALIGQEVAIVVTSVLQTPAGRMIFGRPDQRSSAAHTPFPAPGGATTVVTKPDAGKGTGPHDPLKGGDPGKTS